VSVDDDSLDLSDSPQPLSIAIAITTEAANNADLFFRGILSYLITKIELLAL